MAESLHLSSNSRFPLFIHRFVQLFEVEVYIGCEVVTFCEKGAAYEEDGIRTVDLYHFLKSCHFMPPLGTGKIERSPPISVSVPSQIFRHTSSVKGKRPPKLVNMAASAPAKRLNWP